MTAAVLWTALAAVLAYFYAPLHSSRAPLPRHAGQARRCAPVAAPDEGPARPGGSAPDTSPVPGAEPLPLCVETPALYNTRPQPRLSQEAANEIWWSL